MENKEGIKKFEEFWQYGTDESKTPLIKQDGVAPQAPINSINDKSKYKEGGRAYIPDQVPKGFLLSHFIGNYMWIFEKKVDDAGYVKPRK